jgi:lipid II:glycine glycyltransferase (peptidoglycan interpeptide bridge formation enzyme)
MNFSRIQQRDEWDSLLHSLPDPHLLQSWDWGELKAKYSWHAERWAWRDVNGSAVGAAQVLFRSVRGGITMAYCPRGPIVDWGKPEIWKPFVEEMVKRARAGGVLFIKIDPSIKTTEESSEDQISNSPIGRALLQSGWIISNEQVQFRNTLTLDLTQEEDALLAGMKQKTRYNIRLAGRKSVTVREGSLHDLDQLYKMYAETSIRDGFVIRPKAYYQDAWGSFMTLGNAAPLIAEFDGEPIAAIIAYYFGKTAYYLYGMSRTAHREKMPNYLLQWEAILWAKRMGCQTYDFWGAPHEINEDDRMYGVYRFKLGFGTELVRTPGAWDYPIKPIGYKLYSTFMPLILGLMRGLGRARIRSQVQDI